MEENMCVSFAVMQKKKKLITLYVVQMEPVVPEGCKKTSGILFIYFFLVNLNADYHLLPFCPTKFANEQWSAYKRERVQQ